MSSVLTNRGGVDMGVVFLTVLGALAVNYSPIVGGALILIAGLWFIVSMAKKK
jgi:hypothetical protein